MLTYAEVKEIIKDNGDRPLFDTEMWIPCTNPDAEGADEGGEGNRYWVGVGTKDLGVSAAAKQKDPDGGADDDRTRRGIVYRKKEKPQTVRLPGKVYSLHEVGFEKVIVTFKRLDRCYMEFWDGRKNSSDEDDGELVAKDELHIRDQRQDAPDRDLDLDFEKGILFTLGKKSVVKWELATLRFMDTSELPATPDMLRLNHKKDTLFVLTDARDMHIIPTSTLLPEASFQLDIRFCIEFDLIAIAHECQRTSDGRFGRYV